MAEGRPDSSSFAAAATISGACAVLVASTVHARSRAVSPTETDVFTRVNGLPEEYTPVLYVLMQAGQFGAVPVSAVLARGLRRPRVAAAIVIAGCSAWVLARLVKRVAVRGRPAAHIDAVVIRGREWTGLGFPSGHAAVAAGIATVIAPELPLPLRPLVWTLVGCVALARIYVGAHLPVDTVGGVALGVVTGRVATLIVDP